METKRKLVQDVLGNLPIGTKLIIKTDWEGKVKGVVEKTPRKGHKDLDGVCPARISIGDKAVRLIRHGDGREWSERLKYARNYLEGEVVRVTKPRKSSAKTLAAKKVR